MYLISAYFDLSSSKRIQHYIDQVAMATGNTFMTANKVPPHMTIASIEARTGTELIPVFEQAVSCLKAGEISVVSVGMLLPYVLYATPVLNEYLQDMSQRIYQAFAEMPNTCMSKYYLPMQWLPHITIGKKLTNEQMRQGIEVMMQYFCPFDVKITRIGLSSVNPYRDLRVIELES